MLVKIQMKTIEEIEEEFGVKVSNYDVTNMPGCYYFIIPSMLDIFGEIIDVDYVEGSNIYNYKRWGIDKKWVKCELHIDTYEIDNDFKDLMESL